VTSKWKWETEEKKIRKEKSIGEVRNMKSTSTDVDTRCFFERFVMNVVLRFAIRKRKMIKENSYLTIKKTCR